MTREAEITFNYDNGEEARIVAKVTSAPAPHIFPPVFNFVFDSYTEESGTVKFGKNTIGSGKFKLLDGTDDEGTSEFEIVKSSVNLLKDEDSDYYRLMIFSLEKGTYLPQC